VKATQVTLKTQFRDGNVRAALARLGPKVAQNVIKRSMRKALDPVRAALRQTWVAAGYRGKPLHRRAIDKATRIDVRRAGGGKSAGITGRVGVMYGKSGGTGAGGRQKIWHLLEGGFRHYAKGSKAYANFSKDAKAEQVNYKAIIAAKRPAALAGPRSERAGKLRAVFAAAREAAPTFVAERSGRTEARKTATAKQIPGAFRSRAVASRMLPEITKNLRDYILQAAKEALRGNK
jgi:hypothetical protein